MRLESASAAKHGGFDSGPGWATRQNAPRDGTRIRRMYDLLMANKGVPINVHLSQFEGAKGGAGTNIAQLIDVYGLDIRKLRNGKWVLAGEWFGKTYVDYIAGIVNRGDA